MNVKTIAAILGGASLAAGCVSQGGWTNADALASESVEVAIDGSGRPLEVEFHILPEAVPAEVTEAMDALHPGGRAVAAEKEYVDGELCWELTKDIGGHEIEALFRPSGELFSEEIEIDVGDVPEAVLAAAVERVTGTVTKFEEIRGSERQLVEYHAKITSAGKRYKIRVSPDGRVLGVVREVPAEIEVPVP